MSEAQVLTHIHPSSYPFTPKGVRLFTGPYSVRLLLEPPSIQSPFARTRYYVFHREVSPHVSRHYPALIAPTGSCARPISSDTLCSSLEASVFAGYGEPLLNIGPSRLYLCHPCVGAWIPTPQCSRGGLTRFFPRDIGLTLEGRRSAHQTAPAMQLRQGTSFRGCSHSIMFRLLRSLDPQVAPTAGDQLPGGRAVYTTRPPVRYLPEVWYRYTSNTSN
jgi:hypothetical protein